MSERFSRIRSLIGTEAMDRLASAKVAVFGIGGVGGYVCEALARCGVGAFDLTDMDTVSISNLNRQIIATRQSIGRKKTDVMKERIHDINPDADVTARSCFFLPENADTFPFEEFDYVIDCVDTVTAKIEIIMKAQSLGIPVISAMGAGNKLDPSRFRVADIYDTKVCPLARVMRHELKKRGVEKLKTVYSDEQPLKPVEDIEETPAGKGRKSVPASSAFAPAACGLVIASEVMKDIAGIDNEWIETHTL